MCLLYLFIYLFLFFCYIPHSNLCSSCFIGLADFCKGLVSAHRERDDALADGSSDLLEMPGSFLCDVLMPCEGGGDGESVMKEKERVTGMS